MISHIWSVLCLNPITDERTKRNSYIDCTSELLAPSLPKALPALFVVSYWEAPPGAVKEDWFVARYIFFGPDDEPMGKVETKKIEYSNRFIHITIDFSGIKIKQEGRHKILVEYKLKGGRKWKKATEVPLYIDLSKEK
jgi:hypothetical protein